LYKNRLKIFILAVVLLFIGVILRIGYLQIVKGDSYRLQYEEMLRNVESLPALRGRIRDRNGYILAYDEPCYSLYLDYRLLASDEKWEQRQIRAISRELSLPTESARKVFRLRADTTWRLTRKAAELARSKDLGVQKLPPAEVEAARADMQSTVSRIIRRMKRQEKIVGMTVRGQRQAHRIVSGLDKAAHVALSLQLDKTVGMSVRPDNRRRYPYRSVACHIIGFTTQVWKEDLDAHNISPSEGNWFERNAVNYRDGDSIGRAGIEMMCEKYLRGKRGFRVKQDRKIAKDTPASQGQDVHLTIDIRLQQDVEALLGGRNGCIVVLGVANREVLSMVSAPTYDVNRYQQDFEKLIGDKVNLPLLHRAVKKLYPPGSTMKPLAALAGLGAGLIKPGTEYNCRGYLHTPERFRCWHRTGGHGSIDMVDALKRSCNVYFYKVGEGLGIEMFGEWLTGFGLGDKPGTGLPEERPGNVPRWTDVQRGAVVGEARFMAIGQGQMAATPLHVANAIATVAAGGDFRSPIIALEGGPKQVRRQLPVPSDHAESVRRGMRKVVSESGGTANKYFRQNMPVTAVCAKTGTATGSKHIPDLNGNGRVDPEERESTLVLQGDMAWCVGFAPYNNPKYTFAVVVEFVTSGGGGANAGPIARDLIHLLESPKYGYLK
jgi:penicillin-binding protein 2